MRRQERKNVAGGSALPLKQSPPRALRVVSTTTARHLISHGKEFAVSFRDEAARSPRDEPLCRARRTPRLRKEKLCSRERLLDNIARVPVSINSQEAFPDETVIERRSECASLRLMRWEGRRSANR